MSRQDFHTSIVESLAEADEAEPGPAVPAEVEGGHIPTFTQSDFSKQTHIIQPTLKLFHLIYDGTSSS